MLAVTLASALFIPTGWVLLYHESTQVLICYRDGLENCHMGFRVISDRAQVLICYRDDLEKLLHGG